MKRVFILSSMFENAWARMGLGDDELADLQRLLLSFPDIGDVIPGLHGARKVRIPLPGRGKSGGGRVIYVDVVIKERIYLVTAYAKNVQVDLSEDEKKSLCKIIDSFKGED